MSKRTLKNSKIKHNTPVVLCWHPKNFESDKRQRILFRPQRWHVPYRNYHACCEKLIPKPAPNGTNFLPRMLMLLHDSMPSFMNFRQFLDLLEFKSQVSQRFAGNQQCPSVWNSFPFLAWDLRMHPRTHIWFPNQFVFTEHVHVFQIWIVHIKCLENPVNV